MPVNLYSNERAQEFLDHFGSLIQQRLYYHCQEPVPFDSSDFYDFEEKKFYYLVSHTDYCAELERLCVKQYGLDFALIFSHIVNPKSVPQIS